jgi:hypothetical protein
MYEDDVHVRRPTSSRWRALLAALTPSNRQWIRNWLVGAERGHGGTILAAVSQGAVLRTTLIWSRYGTLNDLVSGCVGLADAKALLDDVEAWVVEPGRHGRRVQDEPVVDDFAAAVSIESGCQVGDRSWP